MKTATPNEVLLIACVRADKSIGRGTCSVIDEAYTDHELLTLLRERNADTPFKALRAARQTQELHDCLEADVVAEAF